MVQIREIGPHRGEGFQPPIIKGETGIVLTRKTAFIDLEKRTVRIEPISVELAEEIPGA